MALVVDPTIHDDLPAVPPARRRPSFLDRPLASYVTRERALVVLGLILLAALFSRFWMLGDRALHHDESLHAVYSYYLFDRGDYRHEPLMHGPLLFHLTAFSYWLFGDSDFTARLVPALLGIFLVWAPWKFRTWMGTRGALATSLLMLISPVILYYSRFIREDVFAAAWTVIIVYGMWGYLRGGRRFHLYTMVVGWALLFSQKEISFLLAFIFWSYLALQLVVRGLRARRRRVPFRWSAQREWALLVVMGCLLLPFITALLMHIPTQLNEKLGMALPILDPGVVGGNSETSVYNSAAGWPSDFKLRAYGTIIVLTLLGFFIAARTWSLRAYAGAAALFFGIVILLHTTFLTNPHGIGSGIVGALGYWIEQHEVQRGDQPWYYYLLLLPLYEFLPLLIALVGAPLLLRKRLSALAGPMERGVERPVGEGADDPEAQVESVAAWPWFLLWWFVGAFAIFSFAGEKMPWLLMHLSLPLIFLAGTIAGRLLATLRLSQLRRPEALLLGAMVLLFTLALGLLIALVVLGQSPFRGMDESSLLATARWLLGALFLLGSGSAISRFSERFDRDELLQIIALALMVPLAAATIRFAYIASFRNADTPNEPLIFVQSSPSVTRVDRELAALSERLTGGNELAIAYDSEVSWPFEWYLRRYPNKFFFASDPQSYADAVRNADVVIAGDATWGKLQPLVPGYDYREYPMRWWFPEEYKKLINRTDPVTGMVTQDRGLPNILANVRGYAQQPSYREDFVDFLLFRRVQQPLGGMRFRVYYKPGLAERVWSPTTPLPSSPSVVEPAAPVESLAAAQVLLGGFQAPRAVAPLPDGRLAVADTFTHRITLLGSDGTVQGSVGGQGAGDGQFNEPWGIAAATDGTLYVADTWNNRIVHLTTDGQLLHQWGTFGDTGGQLGTPSLFYGPRGVAVAADGRVWVTDTGNSRVQLFEPDGTFVAQYGGRGSEPGQMSEPVGISIAPDGTIWVADTWNQRIQGFTADFQPLLQIPVRHWAGQGVMNKPGIAADDSHLWISDPESNLIAEYDREGQLQRTWGGLGAEATQLNQPMGLAARDGQLWVADAGNLRLLRFDMSEP